LADAVIRISLGGTETAVNGDFKGAHFDPLGGQAHSVHMRSQRNGYAAIFGWTQLVRSTDSASAGFEMDPIALYRDVATPFAWYGIRPELFDAPSRDPRANMDWEAHLPVHLTGRCADPPGPGDHGL
jgi:hypothetical protein